MKNEQPIDRWALAAKLDLFASRPDLDRSDREIIEQAITFVCPNYAEARRTEL